MWEPERYRIFEEDGNTTEHTYDQIVLLIISNKIHHHSTIKKVSGHSWTKVGILMEFRDALKAQVKNNRESAD